MNKLIIVTGLPNSGKNEYIKKTYDNTYKVINGESYIDKTVNINIKAIEESRQKCLEEFKNYISENTNNENSEKDQQDRQDRQEKINVVLSLYANSPMKWIEFLEICIDNDFKVEFVIPTHAHVYYMHGKYGDSHSQIDFLSSLSRRMDPIVYIGYDDKGNTLKKSTNLFDRLVTEQLSSVHFTKKLHQEEINLKNKEKNIIFGKEYEQLTNKEYITTNDTLNFIKSHFAAVIEKNKKNTIIEEMYEKSLLEKEERKKLAEENKEKKKNMKKNRNTEIYTDEFYSDAKFENIEKTFDQFDNDNFVVPKNRKERMKEKRKVEKNEIEETNETNEVEGTDQIQ